MPPPVPAPLPPPGPVPVPPAPVPSEAQVVRPASADAVPVVPDVAAPADVAVAAVPLARARTTPVAVCPHASVTV